MRQKGKQERPFDDYSFPSLLSNFRVGKPWVIGLESHSNRFPRRCFYWKTTKNLWKLPRFMLLGPSQLWRLKDTEEIFTKTEQRAHDKADQGDTVFGCSLVPKWLKLKIWWHDMDPTFMHPLKIDWTVQWYFKWYFFSSRHVRNHCNVHQLQCGFLLWVSLCLRPTVVILSSL